MVADAMGDELDAIVVGECGEASAASTVVQVVDGNVRVLREGPISQREIETTLKVHV